MWTHDPGALLAASVGGRYAGSAMTIRNDTAAGAGTQAIRWCVSHLEAETVEGLCRTAGYCHIVDATVTWSEPTVDTTSGLRPELVVLTHLNQRVAALEKWADTPLPRKPFKAPHRCLATNCGAVVDYRLEFCDYHADVATGGTE